MSKTFSSKSQAICFFKYGKIFFNKNKRIELKALLLFYI